MERVKNSLIEKAELDVVHAEIFIGFYSKELEGEKDTEAQGRLKMKIQQLTEGKEFNQKVLNYLKSL